MRDSTIYRQTILYEGSAGCHFDLFVKEVIEECIKDGVLDTRPRYLVFNDKFHTVHKDSTPEALWNRQFNK